MTSIKKLVDAFAADLENLVREDTLEFIRAALLATATTPRAPTAHKTAVSKPATKNRPRGTPGVVSQPASSRVRRSAKQLKNDADRIYLAVRAKPGSSSEQLRSATKLPKASMPRPVQLLLAENRIRKTGKKRATKYFPV